jgi:thiol-disulfide isomerase/thioredoxin
MPARRDFLILGGVGLAAAVTGAIVGPLVLQSESGAADLLSARYPDVAGVPRQLSEWRGRVLVCNFWATWCAPCREEVPMLIETRTRYAPKGAEVVGIGIDNAAKIRQFAADYKINYPVLVADATGLDLMRKVGNQMGGLPYTVVLDRTGSIGYRRLGILKDSELQKVVEGMLR